MSCVLSLSWLFTLDHKRVGMIYMFLGLWGGFLGLSLSFLIRLNYFEPYYNMVSPDIYKFVITKHGLVMIFFFLMPVLVGGFGNYLLPLLLNLPDLVLPRVNALSAWLMFPSSLCLCISMVFGSGVGWTFYPPLSSSEYSGLGSDFLLFSLHLAGVSSMLSSLKFICTMYLSMTEFSAERHSVLVWAYLFTSILLIVSLPVLAAAITMLLFDRKFDSSFFDPVGGGDPVLFQHLFWFFGHPEVYVLMLPGFGAVSHMTMTMGGKDSLFGYYGLMMAMGSMVGLGSVVWGHHMFVVGMDLATTVFFSSVTMMMSVPTGMKVFSWLYMLGGGWNHYSLGDPMIWWIVGFVFLFTVGGVTGIMLSACVVDLLFHDTWFVVAHFHYVLSLGSYSTLVISLIWWWPMISGYSLKKILLQGHWFLSMVGFNLCFFPMHFLGISGLPRRVCCYHPDFMWLNIISSWGGILSMVSGFSIFFILWESVVVGNKMLGSWGSNSVVLKIVSLPTPYHALYMSSSSSWDSLLLKAF